MSEFREHIARAIAPRFAWDAFNAQGHWLNNDARCKALDAADAIMAHTDRAELQKLRESFETTRDSIRRIINDLAPVTRRDEWWATEGPYEIIEKHLTKEA